MEYGQLYMNYKLSLFLTTMVVFILAAFVFFQKTPRNNVKMTFIFYSLCLSVWSSGQLMALLELNQQISLFWVRNYCHSGVIFIPVLFFHFVVCLLGENRKRRKIIILSYFVGIIFFLLDNFSSLVVRGVGLYPPVFDYVYLPGILHPVMVTFFIALVVYGNILLWKSFLRAKGNRRNQLKYLLLAILLSYFGGLPNFLLGYRIQIPILMPFGTYLLPIYVAIVAYTIIKHKLLAMEVFVQKTLIYTLIITVLTISYFISIYLIEKFFRILIGYSSTTLTILFITLFSLTFIPLKNRIQYLLDKCFFHGSIDQINSENIKLREEIQRSEKMKAVATLAAGMAHEIKNPLTAIKTFTEFLEDKGDDPKYRKQFKRIVGKEVDRINYIVKELLEFSRPKDLHLKNADINLLLDETLIFLNNNFLAHNIKIKKNYGTLPQVWIDTYQIKQVFLNIFLNAIDAMQTGGILTIKTAHVPIAAKYDIQDINSSGQVTITITDTGCGMTREDLKHAFDPFFTKKTDGTGLGLSVVHGIVEKHNGKIFVNSKVGQGTEFILYFSLNTNI